MLSLALSIIMASTAIGAVISPKSTKYRTISDSSLCTWWHENAEINTDGPVKPENVRQSRQYNIQVRLAGSCDWYDSFVYESIPRNGNGRIYSPWDAPGSNTLGADVDDGISIENEVGINMAWSQFQYNKDVDVKITRRDGISLGKTSNVVIRPSATPYILDTSDDGGILIHVPADTNGRKFSVEFNDDLYTYRSNGTSGYVLSGGEVVGVEPKNALVIFASPFMPADMVPNMNTENTQIMKPGPINNGDWGSKSILYFPPGVYWMNQNVSGQGPALGQNHIKLSPATTWVHFAPGSYVKAAVEYTTHENFYSTGHGVLSGEHYVYQANVNSSYQALKSDQTSLRLWWHNDIVSGQTWYCEGPTISSPPFNTMDFNGEHDGITTRVSDYKQVGAFFYQTDGPENYPNSIVHNVFYHVNDDGIKTYYSNATITNITIWKCHNDPIIQMGWTTRNVTGVIIDHMNIIHTRYTSADMGVPTSIIGGSPFYSDGQTIDPASVISMTVSNVVCEGRCPSLLRINPLQSYKNFVVKNIAMPDGLLDNSLDIGQSIIPYAPNTTMELEITNWTVGGEKITYDNYRSNQLGQFNISGEYYGQWSIN